MARLFFAVWPDAAAAAALSALAGQLVEACGGRPVPAAKLHLTLAFLGEVDAERTADLLRCVRFRGRRFRLELDRVGGFRRARVAWAGPSTPPPELGALQEKLAARLAAGGFALEEREFNPHLTLARRIERALPGASVAPIAWEADEFTLVRSEIGTGRYHVVERWPLGA
jgi:RNA 2',3'-cyclic 3'-phosphodiesterase